jgi:hypothetical protein
MLEANVKILTPLGPVISMMIVLNCRALIPERLLLVAESMGQDLEKQETDVGRYVIIKLPKSIT